MSDQNKKSLLDSFVASRTLSEVNKGYKRTTVIDVDFKKFNEKFVGKIKFHHPTQMERIDIGVKRTRILQGLDNEVDQNTHNIAHIVATLDTVMDDYPDWLDLSDIEIDYEILEHIFKEYAEWMSIFRQEKGNTGSEQPSQES